MMPAFIQHFIFVVIIFSLLPTSLNVTIIPIAQPYIEVGL